MTKRTKKPKKPISEMTPEERTRRAERLQPGPQRLKDPGRDASEVSKDPWRRLMAAVLLQAVRDLKDADFLAGWKPSILLSKMAIFTVSSATCQVTHWNY